MGTELVPLEEFEAWIHAEMAGFWVNPDTLQGIHLAPGEEMMLNMNVIIYGKDRFE